MVVTISSDQALAMQQWDDARFTAWVQQQLGERLGTPTLRGKRHLYPLVAGVCAALRHPRFALISDAAVGMRSHRAATTSASMASTCWATCSPAPAAPTRPRQLAVPQPYETIQARTWPIFPQHQRDRRPVHRRPRRARLLRQAVVRGRTPAAEARHHATPDAQRCHAPAAAAAHAAAARGADLASGEVDADWAANQGAYPRSRRPPA